MAEKETQVANQDEEEDALGILPGPLNYSDDQELDDPDDMSPLPLRLMQGLSPAVTAGDASPGEYHILGVGEVEDPVIIPLARNKSRNRRIEDPDDEDETVLVCHSPDGKFGEGDPGGECAKCPFSKWEGRTPPLCSDQWSYILYLPNEGILAEWTLQRTGMSTAKTINSLIAMSGFGKLAFSLSSQERGSKKRRYFVPILKKVPIDEEWDIGEIQQMLATNTVTPKTEEEALAASN